MTMRARPGRRVRAGADSSRARCGSACTEPARYTVFCAPFMTQTEELPRASALPAIDASNSAPARPRARPRRRDSGKVMPRILRQSGMHASIDRAVGMQRQQAIGGRLVVDDELIRARLELRAGGGSREEAHAAARAFEWLMHVAPDHRLDLRMAVDDRPEFVGVREPDLVEPAALHRDRVVMQAHHRMALPRACRALHRAWRAFRPRCVRRPGSRPRCRAARSARRRCRPGRRARRAASASAARICGHEIVIARHAQYGLAEAREHAAEVFVAARVVLHEIARDQDGVGNGDVTRGVGERALERLERIHAAQRFRRVAEQMRVGELDDSDCAHSFELYKQAEIGRVMRVTT